MELSSDKLWGHEKSSLLTDAHSLGSEIKGSQYVVSSNLEGVWAAPKNKHTQW